jgi:hypothetical protein
MLSDYQNKFALKTIQRKQTYLVISILSVIIGVCLTLYYSWLANTVIDFEKGIHAILIILILLNARQNLRQYNYAKILEAIFLKERPS